jgi:hypothetical protein
MGNKAGWAVTLKPKNGHKWHKEKLKKENIAPFPVMGIGKRNR